MDKALRHQLYFPKIIISPKNEPLKYNYKLQLYIKFNGKKLYTYNNIKIKNVTFLRIIF